jgi:hypothetical protein
MLIKGRTYLLILVCLCLAFFVYFFENKVHEISEKISATEEKLARYDEDLKVLEAEWSYLNNPERLTLLAEKIHTDMNSPVKMQFTDLKNLPTREVLYTNAQSQRIIP